MGWLSVAGLLLLVAGQALADAPSGKDPSTWLDRIDRATHQTSYSGVFVLQRGHRMESSRLVHGFDKGQEVFKIDALDGRPREIIRNAAGTRCYFPMARALRDEQGYERRLFPDLIHPPFESYRENYTIELGGTDRLSGRTCQEIEFQPRDHQRFAHEFCADLESGLILRAQTLGANGEPVMSATFTELTVGVKPSADSLETVFRDITGWRRVTLPEDRTNHREGAIDWQVDHLPAGFHQTLALHWDLPNGRGTMTHLIYSDGLDSLSVFIEPHADQGSPPSRRGHTLSDALGYYSGVSGIYRITVVGEVPAETVTLIGQSVKPKGNPRP